jgi:hypothetical protein
VFLVISQNKKLIIDGKYKIKTKHFELDEIFTELAKKSII